MNIYICVFIRTHAFISLGEIPSNEIAGSHSMNMFNLLRNYKIIFQIGCTISHSDQFQFLHILPNSIIGIFYILTILIGV